MMGSSKEVIVVSKRGTFWFLGCLSGVLFAVFSVVILFAGATKTEGLFAAILGAPLFTLLVLYLGTVKYTISLRGIDIINQWC